MLNDSPWEGDTGNSDLGKIVYGEVVRQFSTDALLYRIDVCPLSIQDMLASTESGGAVCHPRVVITGAKTRSNLHLLAVDDDLDVAIIGGDLGYPAESVFFL